MTLGIDQTADLLKISPATVKNWLKAGVLKSTTKKEILAAQKRIASGKLKRLQSRANRLQSKKLHSHAELLSNKKNLELLNSVLSGVETKELLLAIYLLQLESKKLLSFDGKNFLALPKIEMELREWGLNFKKDSFVKFFKKLKSMPIDLNDNLLGYVYQSKSQVSQKHDKGAYYTPLSAVKKTMLNINRPGTLCDPCCGSGNFLVEAYLHLKKLKSSAAKESVFGYDCDELAVLTARANLTLVSEGKVDTLRAVQKLDYLNQNQKRKFDYITTNPPWGSFSQKKRIASLKKRYNFEKTSESFSFFLAESLLNLNKNGHLIFVLPISFSGVSTHKEIRRFIFSNYSVVRIEKLQERFSGVLTGALLIEIKNHKPSAQHKISILGHSRFEVDNSAILDDPLCVIPLNSSEESLKIIKEIELKAVSSLKDNAMWGLGIVTGNNNKYLTRQPGKGLAKIVKGSEIKRFQKLKPTHFVPRNFSNYQQSAPLNLYLSPKKLIYRFICSELVFTVDRQKFFTLNSANILIPEGNSYSCEVLCAILNSKLAQYYHSGKNYSVKVLRSHLESFPLPKVSPQDFSEMEKLVTQLESKYDQMIMDQLDELVFSVYSLSEKSKSVIREATFSKAFV